MCNSQIDQPCRLCGKAGTYTHLQCNRHMRMVAEHAQLDVAAGPTRALRVLTPTAHKGLPCGPNGAGLTQERFLAHWGSTLPESFPRFALDRFKAVGVVSLNGRPTPYNPSFRATLILVSYGGQGKCGDVCTAIPWAMVPREGQRPEWTLTFPEQASGPSFWWPTVHLWVPGDYDSENEYVWLRTRTGCWVLVVVCIYQWMWPAPAGWPVRAVQWSRL